MKSTFNSEFLAQYVSIIEWMYENEQNYTSKTEWRKAFTTMLRDVLCQQREEEVTQ